MQEPKKIHFVGICGTAMGAVAAAMKARGIEVTGSDANVYPPMSTFLESRGIPIQSGFRAENLPADAELVVIGNAMARGNSEVEEILNRKLPYLSLPETLKFFFLRGKHNLVVTGTHGKTTTTSMLAWIFESSGRNPSFLIGGIPTNLKEGCRLHEDGKFCILEGDEYDTAFFDKRSKFIHYLPELVIVNNLEFDHADIFHDLDAIKLSFRRMLNIVPSEGMVLVNADDENCLDITKNLQAPVLEVGFSENAANQIKAARQQDGDSYFQLFGEEFKIPLIGEFNIRNAAMAASAAHFYGISFADIRKALAAFQGIRRRQEIRGVVHDVTVIDDFGHHPTAIANTLAAMRERYTSARLWAIFEPRSNTTRRAVFQEKLPAAFADADGVFISEVARLDQLAPNERLDPQRVVADIAATGKIAHYEPGADAIVAKLIPQTKSGDIIIVFSNGGFDGIHQKLLDALA
ncbi:MAG: UDP-N-acetylmuramate:L-alanyl-gamma-D-glutamyl-meso-diaminopimelate ligase [Chthoniobacterales bacterium]